MESNGRQIISQSHAARLRGVSRQRINELVSKGRFTTPTDAQGHAVEGTVYLDEVLNFEKASAGRPRESQVDWFVVGSSVLWNMKPRNSYGYTLPIIATVEKSSNKRLLLKFVGGDEIEHTAWANREDCTLLTQLAIEDEKELRLEALKKLAAEAQRLKLGY